MKCRTLIAASAALASAGVFAQAGPVAEKSAAEITCELTGDCDSYNQELAVRDEGPDRKFSLRLPGKGAAAAPGVAPGGARAQMVRVAEPAVAARAAPGGARRQLAASVRPVTPVGRSNLSIGFANGSAALTPEGLSQARRLLDALKAPGVAGKRFLVGGHTDSVGNRDYNLDLSRRRAEALVKFLSDNGVESSRLEAKGFGFDQPLPGLSARNGANRRVEIVKVD